MSAVICQITEAIAQAIQAEPLSMPFTATASTISFNNLTGLSTLQIDVFPASIQTSRLDRMTFETSYEINLVLKKKVSNEQTEIPELLEVLEQLSSTFLNGMLSGDDWKIIIIGSEVSDLFSLEQVRSDKIFSSTISLQVKRLS